MRLNAPRIARLVIFNKVLSAFLAAYPDIEVEIFYDDGVSNIVSEGIDAGLRLGQLVEPDMVSRALTPQSKMVVAASPDYLDRFVEPKTPHDLKTHQYVNFRRPTQRTIYHWRFVVDGKDIHLPVAGKLTFKESASKLQWHAMGLGLLTRSDPLCRDIDAGTLVSVLDDYLPTIPGFHIYFPSRAQVMLKLRVFIDFALKQLKEAD